MSNREIGKALLNVDGSATSAAAEARQVVEQVIHRDRWRIRILAGMSSFFCAVTVVGVIYLICFYFLYVVPRLDAYAAGRLQLQDDWNDWIRAFNAGAEILFACIIGFLLAAVSMVALVLASRNAVLRQIQAELSEISSELKQLRLSQSNSAGS
jgi:hypothetical protein